jgi:hypothetical protein
MMWVDAHCAITGYIFSFTHPKINQLRKTFAQHSPLNYSLFQT